MESHDAIQGGKLLNINLKIKPKKKKLMNLF